MKALIKVGYGCNQRCTFCHSQDTRHLEATGAEVEAKIRRARRLGHDMVVFSGGEATVRPELTRWAALAGSLGMRFGLVTNGLVLSYPDAVTRLLRLGLGYVYLSLHGPAEVHDAIVGAPGFSRALAALGNLSGKGLDLTINAVVVRQNLEHLDPLVDACAPFADATLKFSMVQPKGGARQLFDALVPRVSQVAERVRAAIARGRRTTGLRFAHDGIPFCLLPGCEDLYDDLKTHRFASMVEAGEQDFSPVDDHDKVQPDGCDGCALRGPCPGLYRAYREVFGDAELAPVAGRPRSNSFNYVLEASLPAAAGACPLLEDGVTPWNHVRHLFVREGERINRYRSQTRDFADAEIELARRAGQLYLDVSDKPAPDDFARDLVQLRPSPGCAGCPGRDRCTGLFERAAGDVFSRDDQRVRALVAGLRGDVLDVGCGEGAYDDLLGPLAAEGRLRYTGLEPDAARLEAQRPRRPWANLRQGCAEQLLDERAFDHALVLRSWNHLADPQRALERLRRALRPGGRLTVVDNVAFGLARSAPQALRAQGSAAGFEHFRNHAAADAERLVRAAGFSVLERHEVGPGTSNQWLLSCLNHP